MSNTNSGPNTRLPQYTLKHDGDYLFVIHISGSPGSSFNAAVELEMQGMSNEYFLVLCRKFGRIFHELNRILIVTTVYSIPYI